MLTSFTGLVGALVSIPFAISKLYALGIAVGVILTIAVIGCHSHIASRSMVLTNSRTGGDHNVRNLFAWGVSCGIPSPQARSE